MKEIIKSLQSKFPSVKFQYMGLSKNNRYHVIYCNKFILTDPSFLIRASSLTKRFSSQNFIVMYKRVF